MTDSEADSDYENHVSVKVEQSDALDINGEKLLDRKGQVMVKVCEAEEENKEDAQRELHEIQDIQEFRMPPRVTQLQLQSKHISSKPLAGQLPKLPLQDREPRARSSTIKGEDVPSVAEESRIIRPSRDTPEGASSSNCTICSVENESGALICAVCLNVLWPDFVVGSWKCQSSTCKDGSYVNMGDVVICGICGMRKIS